MIEKRYQSSTDVYRLGERSGQRTELRRKPHEVGAKPGKSTLQKSTEENILRKEQTTSGVINKQNNYTAMLLSRKRSQDFCQNTRLWIAVRGETNGMSEYKVQNSLRSLTVKGEREHLGSFLKGTPLAYGEGNNSLSWKLS